jgi:hypothetical protein
MRTVSKLPQENRQVTAPKITKKENGEELKKSMRNHAESSIHTMKGSYNVYLPPDDPALSLDLTTKLSSQS